MAWPKSIRVKNVSVVNQLCSLQQYVLKEIWVGTSITTTVYLLSCTNPFLCVCLEIDLPWFLWASFPMGKPRSRILVGLSYSLPKLQLVSGCHFPPSLPILRFLCPQLLPPQVHPSGECIVFIWVSVSVLGARFLAVCSWGGKREKFL